MQLSTIIFALGGIALANAAPATAPEPQSFAIRDPMSLRSVEDTLYVTFWKEGCAGDEAGTSSTFYINESDGSDRPEDCVLNMNYGWQSVNIRQPSDDSFRYTIDLFSGEGCNNPILTVSENGCYTQPEGQIAQSFRAHLL